MQIPEIFEAFRETLESFEKRMEMPGEQQVNPMEITETLEYERALEYTDEAITFTEGSYSAWGRYTPGSVKEVDPEAAEFDPELAELSGELNSWILQGENMSCAVASQTMAVNQLENGFHRESDLIEIGERNGWYNEGTYPADVGKIAEHLGMDVEQMHGVKAGELEMANDPELKVLANVDSTLLQFPESGKRCQPDHVVQVLRVEENEKGAFVILNDPGHEGGRGAVYPLEVFEKAFRGDITKIRKEAQA